MPIWSAEIKELEKLHGSFKGLLPDLEKELERLFKTDDENIILIYSRRCLEVIITDLCECELKRPRKTEPLKGVIDKLHKEEKVPSNIITSMDHLNSLSVYGAHPKDFDPEQVKPVLVNLDIIIKWYLKYKGKDIEAQAGEEIQIGEEPSQEVTKQLRIEQREKPVKLSKYKLLSRTIITVIFVIAAIIIYLKIFNKNTLERLRSSGERISVAVMPFQNLTNDTLWNVWQSGIQNELISYLSSSPDELKVRQIQSVKSLLDSRGIVNYASITPDIASSISKKLDANVFISGSLKRAEGILRLNAQLIDAKSEEVFKSFQVEGSADKILNIVDSLSGMVKNSLLITRLEKEMSPEYKHILPTNSAEAYRYFIYGTNAFNEVDFLSAIKLDSQAFAIDSNFIQAAVRISISYYDLERFKDAKRWFQRINNRKDQLPMWGKILLNRMHAMLYETPAEEIKYHRQLLEFDDQFPASYYNIGNDYTMLGQFEKAIPELEKALEIYKRWNTKPSWANDYSMLEYAYFMTGQYRKLEKISRKAEHDFPDDFYINGAQAVISSVIERDTITGNKYLEKCKSILREDKLSDSDIASNLGLFFSMVDIAEKAEMYLRQALALEPENPHKMNDLAHLLINSNLNINEGLELVDSALVKDPDNYKYLETKGWGLYLKGNYTEALDLLKRSWVKRREEAIYDHEAYLHLEEVKKAVTGQQNN